MPKLLTRLRIDEVSAVDRGAGDGVKIVLMKRASRSDATPADTLRAFPNPSARRVFEEIFRVGKAGDRADADDDGWYEKEVAKAVAQNEEHLRANGLDRDDGGGGGATDHHASRVADLLIETGKYPHRAAALDHLLHTSHGQALLSRMNKKDTTPMKDTVYNVMKDCGGPVAFAKTICDTGRSYGVSEQEYVEAVSHHASELYGMPGDKAFAKLCDAEASVLRACGVLKAAEFNAFDIKPVVVGGEDARDVDNATAAVAAYEEIVRIGREKFPFLPADQQFARVFEDKNYAALAAQAHRRPGPTTIYAMPGSAAPGRGAYTKADPAPNADSAYAELMAKAEEYRNAHPELSISQAFEKVFTAPANIELTKRERMESAASR
jgi:hypothetical protein